MSKENVEIVRRLVERYNSGDDRVGAMLDAGDMVVTLGRMEVRGGLSGVPTGQPLAQLVRIGDGRVVSVRGNLSADEALRAAGLHDTETTRSRSPRPASNSKQSRPGEAANPASTIGPRTSQSVGVCVSAPLRGH